MPDYVNWKKEHPLLDTVAHALARVAFSVFMMLITLVISLLLAVRLMGYSSYRPLETGGVPAETTWIDVFPPHVWQIVVVLTLVVGVVSFVAPNAIRDSLKP